MPKVRLPMVSFVDVGARRPLRGRRTDHLRPSPAWPGSLHRRRLRSASAPRRRTSCTVASRVSSDEITGFKEQVGSLTAAEQRREAQAAGGAGSLAPRRSACVRRSRVSTPRTLIDRARAGVEPDPQPSVSSQWNCRFERDRPARAAGRGSRPSVSASSTTCGTTPLASGRSQRGGHRPAVAAVDHRQHPEEVDAADHPCHRRPPTPSLRRCSRPSARSRRPSRRTSSRCPAAAQSAAPGNPRNRVRPMPCGRRPGGSVPDADRRADRATCRWTSTRSCAVRSASVVRHRPRTVRLIRLAATAVISQAEILYTD